MDTNYNYCCSEDGHGLEYPGFSVVFIHTFTVDKRLQFFMLPSAVEADYEEIEKLITAEAVETKVHREIADFLDEDLVYMNQNMERQIFVVKNGDRLETCYMRGELGSRRMVKEGGEKCQKVYCFPEESVYRCSLRGFDFDMPLRPAEDEDFEPRLLKGHVNVEMSCFFGNTISMTYRFLFDGYSSRILSADGKTQLNATTDHIIALLSTFLGAEYWSDTIDKSDEEEGDSIINMETVLNVYNMWIDENGNSVPPSSEPLVLEGEGRKFDDVAERYKRFLYRNNMAFKAEVEKEDRVAFRKKFQRNMPCVQQDSHYAMVDIWENVSHPEKGGKGDLFSLERRPKLSEAEIVSHIREYHKSELIGLLTLYPCEWPYRDDSSYDEVCGENIAIDTDDLVLAGSNLSVVIGTYGRRGAVAEDGRKKGVNWANHLRKRAYYHVSWPEYLLILQMVLAKKHIIGRACELLMEASLHADKKSAEQIIGDNAETGMTLSRVILQLDVVQYSKFASHKVMFDRTARRLGLEEEMQQFDEISDIVDSSLHNLSDYNAIKEDFTMNIVLSILSCAATFELFFQDSEMPFLSYFDLETTRFSALFVLIVAAVSLFAILVVLKNVLRKLWFRLRAKLK